MADKNCVLFGVDCLGSKRELRIEVSSRHGTSDEFYDPHCDSCYEDGGQNIRAYGFCTNCVQFLCTNCYNVHGRLQATRHHDVVYGKDMPKSQADKPPRFDSCEPLSKMKATKQDTYNVKLRDDTRHCWITGMAIRNDRRILMADFINDKVKMFSHDMKFLSSVSVPDEPWDIVVISDREAVVTTTNKSLVILDISGSQLSIKTTTQLSFDVRGISRYNDKLVVTSPDSKPPSVKLIDQTGRVYWSVSSDQQGQPLFSCPWYVSSPGDGRSSTVIVTDGRNNKLTFLNGGTGEVITRRQLEKSPYGVTTDSSGYVYVSYWETSEVAVLAGDLSEEKILLSTRDGLSDHPQAITYDDTTHHLIISYGYGNFNVERYMLS